MGIFLNYRMLCPYLRTENLNVLYAMKHLSGPHMILSSRCHSGWLIASVQSCAWRLTPANIGYVPFPCFFFNGTEPVNVNVHC